MTAIAAPRQRPAAAAAPRPVPGRVIRAAKARIITAQTDWIPVALFLTFLLPIEAKLQLGQFALFPYRLALIAAAPVMVQRALRYGLRPTVADLAILFTGMWIWIATAVVYGGTKGLVSGGVQCLDLVLAYFAGRTLIRSETDLRRMLYRIAPALLVVGVLLVAESVSHTFIVRPFFGAISGFSPDAILARSFEIRLGMMRALGPFQHAIGGGLFMATFLPLYYFADLAKQRWTGMIAALLGFFTFSSAAAASIVFGIGMVVYDRIRRVLGLGWGAIVAVVLVGLVVVELVSQNGVVSVIIRYMSFNPQTGYFRLAIWEYGWADILRHPWFGIGFEGSYRRPAWMVTDSVDNYWVQQPLRFGLPVLVSTLLAVVYSIYALAIHPVEKAPEALTGRSMKTGLTFTLVIAYALIISVAPWGAEMAWLLMLLGMAGGISDRSSAQRRQGTA